MSVVLKFKVTWKRKKFYEVTILWKNLNLTILLEVSGWGGVEVELIVNSIIFFNRLEGYSTYEFWLVLSTNMKQKKF